jgi:hypothetical protein
MPWIDALVEPRLRRCIRDLVALSTLPAMWKDHTPQQVADSVAAALLSMLNADVVVRVHSRAARRANCRGDAHEQGRVTCR